mgnify:FL=1
MYLAEDLQNKWGPVLDHPDLGKIGDTHKRSITAIMLENTEKALREERGILAETTSTVPVNFMGGSSSTAGTGGIDTFDPVLISLVRRAMPNLIAYDICGTQPMTGPTGLIFAMRSRYSNQFGSGTSANGTVQANETFYNEVNTSFSSVVSGSNTFGQNFIGTIPGATNTSPMPNVAGNTSVNLANAYNTGTGMSTAQAEALGADSNTLFNQMAFTIEKVTVTALSDRKSTRLNSSH